MTLPPPQPIFKRPKRPTILNYVGWGVWILLWLAFDQYTKALALDYAAQEELPLYITSFFNIVLVGNKGVTFGLCGIL